MPESFRAFCKMVSLTAAKTRRILDVSVAWVRLYVLIRGPAESMSGVGVRTVDIGSSELG